MVKQKNHTGANATFKDHANGIKKAPRVKYVSLKGMDPKFLKNQRYAKRKDPRFKLGKKKVAEAKA